MQAHEIEKKVMKIEEKSMMISQECERLSLIVDESINKHIGKSPDSSRSEVPSFESIILE